MKNIKYVNISGYGWTGSSACVDILNEFENFGVVQGEFRIAKDPYGLRDLEESLVSNWDVIRHDVAIRDFLSYCDVLSRKTGLFSQVGKDFSNKLGVNFMLESTKYIDKLTDMTYMGDTAVHRYNIPAYKNFFMKVRSKIGKNNAKPMYFARPANKDEFLIATRNYINNLFSNFIKLEKISTIVLDQAVSPTNIINTSKFYKNMKIIIIDRDPRDIYANMVRGRGLLGPELTEKDSVEKYIKWHKNMRKIADNDSNSSYLDKNLLRMNFEDLVIDSEKSIKKIIDFLGNNDVHEKKGMYFDPSYSIKNIGLWKQYYNQKVMSRISEELSEYCYK